MQDRTEVSKLQARWQYLLLRKTVDWNTQWPESWPHKLCQQYYYFSCVFAVVLSTMSLTWYVECSRFGYRGFISGYLLEI